MYSGGRQLLKSSYILVQFVGQLFRVVDRFVPKYALVQDGLYTGGRHTIRHILFCYELKEYQETIE
jgi:hypothetical protein